MTWTKETRPVSPGRPPSLRTQIEAKFGKNGSDAWDVLESIMHGRLESVQEHVLSDGRIVEYIRRPTIAERKDAAITVIQYLEGKPPQATLNVNANMDLAKLSTPELQLKVAEILAKFAAPALQEHAPAAEKMISVEAERVLVPGED